MNMMRKGQVKRLDKSDAMSQGEVCCRLVSSCRIDESRSQPSSALINLCNGTEYTPIRITTSDQPPH